MGSPFPEKKMCQRNYTKYTKSKYPEKSQVTRIQCYYEFDLNCTFLDWEIQNQVEFFVSLPTNFFSPILDLGLTK